jgi:hypothetical protein
MALVGNTFYQASSLDPGTGYPMYYWNQTNTGLIYVRNAADTAWILVGDSAQPYLGQLSTQGGNMNGAISGAHGLAPATVNDFTSNLYKAGLEVATKSYVDTQDATLNAAIGAGIASAIASVPALNLSSRVAYARDSWTFTGTSSGNVIPLPFYSDGVQASEAECIWGAWWGKLTAGYYVSDNLVLSITETSNRVFDLVAQKQTSIINFNATVNWMIIAFRKTT